MNDSIAIEVKSIKKRYLLFESSRDRLKELLHIGNKIRHQEFYALKGIDFNVKKGETFGIIGTNGSGKSTLLKIITGVASASEGEIEVYGRVSALLELGAGFNTEYTGLENIYLNGIMMGITREEMRDRINEVLDFADIGDFIYQPVKTYSSGMFARLAFAVAINVEPEILIVDEALSVGDVFFQNKCFRKFEELRNKGTTVLFVSHDIATVKQMCSRVLWIEQGKQMMVGDSVEVCNAYSNAILKKRTVEYEKNKDFLDTAITYKRQKLQIEQYPEISYTNESILSQEVRITSCFLSDSVGKTVTECDVNREYTLSLVFESDRLIEQCIGGFVLETVKGLWIINCNTAINGNEGGFRIEKGSVNKIDFTFRMPAIMNGDYVMGVAISEGTEDSYNVLTWLYHVMYVRINNSAKNFAVIDIPTEIALFSSEI